jgi:FKBP-type peptidyl-prolyl cis-trans isomerase
MLVNLLLISCVGPTPIPHSYSGEKPFFYGPPEGATRTASGIAYVVTTPGTGTEHPTSESEVTVHYSGWTGDGTMFDSSRSRGEPLTFALDTVIPGWTEGVQLMVVGESTRFWIPAQLAYGYSGGGPVGQLVFDIELLSFEE